MLAAGDRTLGDHNCATYRGRTQREHIALDWFRQGLSTDEKLVYVPGGGDGPDPVAEWLRDTFPAERVIFSDVSDIYPAGGSFDGPATVQTFRDLAAAARSEGFSSLRAMADLTALAADRDVADDLLNYELLIDGTVEQEGLHGLCVYDRQVIGAHACDALAATHPMSHRHARPTAMVRGEVLSLRGELDLLGVDSIVDVLSNVPDDVHVVSLDGLDFVDATGGRALWSFANARRDHGNPVEFTGATRIVGAVLGSYGLAV